MKMRQFNWSRNWPKVEKHLDDIDVQFALDLGMSILDPYWESGDAPCDFGRGPMNGQRVVFKKLSWHQPWGRCHWIAPFSWAIGQKLFPSLKWSFLTGDFHTVAVGLKNNDIEIVMDILLFKENSAESSIALVKKSEWKMCDTIQEVFVKQLMV